MDTKGDGQYNRDTTFTQQGSRISRKTSLLWRSSPIETGGINYGRKSSEYSKGRTT